MIHTQWSIVVQLLFLHLSATLSCQSRPLLIVAHADDETLFGLPIFLTTPSSCRPHVVVLTVTHPSRVQQMQHAAQRYNFTFDSLDYPDGPTHHQFDTDERIHHQLSSIITTGGVAFIRMDQPVNTVIHNTFNVPMSSRDWCYKEDQWTMLVNHHPCPCRCIILHHSTMNRFPVPIIKP